MGRRAKLEPQQRQIVIEHLERGEPARTVAHELGVAPSTVYRCRARARQIANESGRAVRRQDTSVVEAPLARSLATASFDRVELLSQADALVPAAEALTAIGRAASDEVVRLEALARLVDVRCELSDACGADRALAGARSSASRLPPGLGWRAEIELGAATARIAYTRHDLVAHRRALTQLDRAAAKRPRDERTVRLLARALADSAYLLYFAHRIPEALQAVDRASKMLERLAAAAPSLRAHVLMAVGSIAWRDPLRVHDAIRSNREALLLTLNSGMPAMAQRILYNALYHAAFCDEQFARGTIAFADAVLGSDFGPRVAPEDPLLAAVAATAHRDTQTAFVEIARARMHEVNCSFDPSPSLGTLHARALYLAGDYRHAEHAAVEAQHAWEGSEQDGSGYALRIRAEALAAAGHRREAAKVAVDTIAALEPSMPLHHLFAAYETAFQTTGRRAYAERLHDLRAEVARSRRHANSSLTQREHEVAHLAACGMTNRAIASELGLRPKTVAHYLASVFAELQIRARWQLTPTLLAEVAVRSR